MFFCLVSTLLALFCSLDNRVELLPRLRLLLLFVDDATRRGQAHESGLKTYGHHSIHEKRFFYQTNNKEHIFIIFVAADFCAPAPTSYYKPGVRVSSLSKRFPCAARVSPAQKRLWTLPETLQQFLIKRVHRIRSAPKTFCRQLVHVLSIIQSMLFRLACERFGRSTVTVVAVSNCFHRFHLTQMRSAKLTFAKIFGNSHARQRFADGFVYELFCIRDAITWSRASWSSSVSLDRQESLRPKVMSESVFCWFDASILAMR